MPKSAKHAGAQVMTGGRAVVESLKSEGVTTVFGIISIHTLPIFEALRAERGIRLIVPRHEMAAGFMADGFSRVTGQTGVYLTSTGPGAANSIGAVQESWCASSRTLQITSQIESYLLKARKGTLHEVKDQLGMFTAAGARAVHVGDPRKIAPAIHQAMQALREGRPAPQVIEIPIDWQFAEQEIEIGGPLPVEETPPGEEEIERAAALLMNALRPVFWIGGGVNTAGAQAQARRLAGRLGWPVFTTRGGRGALDDDHPLVVGNYFTEQPAREYLERADVILAVGTKFSWHSTAQLELKLNGDVIRVDIDPCMLDQNYPSTVGIRAEPGPALSALADRIETLGYEPSDRIRSRAASLKCALRENFRRSRPRTAALMDAIDENSPRDRWLISDATIPSYWGTNQYLPVHVPCGYQTPRLSAIGPGYPMALGVQTADPDRPVVCVAGDGGFQVHLAELATAVQENLNVVLIVFNNQGYGILKVLQQGMGEGRSYGVDLHTPDFVKVAEACGMAGERVMQAAELGPAVRRAFQARAPYLIDVHAPFDSFSSYHASAPDRS